MQSIFCLQIKEYCAHQLPYSLGYMLYSSVHQKQTERNLKP